VAKSSADPSKTASATITVPNVGISINPSSISLLAGGPKTFSCTVTGTINTGCTFSLTEAGGGNLAAGGVYTAPVVGGLYHVVAQATADTTRTATAAITVSSPAVVISPKTATLIVGGQQAFGCTVTGAVDTACSWSVLEALGGLVGALTGIYVAPLLTGTYHVTAQSHANPAITDQATITVQPVGTIPVVVTISPTAAALTPNQTQTFSCNVTGSSNVACSYSVTESGGGVVSAAGVYTAPAAVGTYHVVATSQADNTKSATASITVTSGNDAVMSFADVHQTVDGFGAASAFSVYNSMTDAQADHFFSTTAGIGLSLLRFQIDSDGGTADLVTAQKAQARGARVWATPWTPPAAWKSNGQIANGGSLLPAHYQDWANSLTNFVKNMKTSGVNIYAVSIQNEPDFVASYDSATYTGQQFHDFIAVLGPTFAANAITAKIMLPETSNWDAMAGLSDPSLLDPATAKYVGIAATHAYAGNVYHPYPNAQNQGIPLWETEVSDFNGFDSSIGSGINYATQIHNCMVVANCTAWHFWWFKATQGDNEGLQSSAGVDSYRYWAMGNFAKFVRPGFVRIGVTGGTSGVSISAYKDPATGKFAVVAINPSFSSATQRFVLSGASAALVTPQLTSSTANLAAQATIDSSSGAFSMVLPAQSIITFTGTSQ
jgi:glucuronoarabinoxylan endo-1,4-beta-xylanase